MEISDFIFLEKKALELGAVEAKVIPANDVVVEDRVVLKCKTGCDDYGSKLCCPPYAPSVDEFRKMLKDYHYALFMKFRSESKTDDDVSKNLLRYLYDPEISCELKEKAQKFYADWSEDAKRILLAVLKLEQTAFNSGYAFAVGFMTGSCILCPKCNMSTKVCTHPTMMRFPEHAVGINMIKTAEKAGSSVKFPIKGRPEPTGLLLID
jgi:predicted metal-binding protein